jgi:hypothetical protein
MSAGLTTVHAQWKQGAAVKRAAPATMGITTAAEPAATALNNGYVSMAGDDDGFGYGAGWRPPSTCETFDNRGPDDAGVFDQRQPGSTYDSICSFAGGWTHSWTPPPGGSGQFSISLRILGGTTATAYCWAGPCGCATPAQKIFINGTEYPFFGDPGCGQITSWGMTWTGNEANALAAAGTLDVQVQWGNNPFAIDYSRVTMAPVVEVAVEDGDGQRAVVEESAEKPLKVKFTTLDPTFNLASLHATFEVISVPANAAGHGVGASADASAQTYSAPVDSSGIASAVVRLGDKEGAYVVRVKSALSLTGSEALFTTTAVKPDSVAVLKDTTDVAEATDTYAVAASGATTFNAIGLDANGQKIGPIRCNWSLAGGGNPSTRGSGTLAPTDAVKQTTFTPSSVGRIKLSANPLLSGVPTGQVELFITSAYVDIDGDFSSTNPVDDANQFVPGALPDGSSVDPLDMPQIIHVHVLTGASSRGSVKFELLDVSAYPGTAMNFPLNSPATTPDLVLESASMQAQTVPVAFSGTTSTSIKVLVKDYAAKGRLRMTVTSGRSTYTLPVISLPADQNGNGIADRGWRAENANIADSALGAGRDEDGNPVQRRALPDPADTGAIGDNLTNFEEYRGFVLFGRHIRTNPFQKDLFIEAGDFSDDVQYAYPALPTATHRTSTSDVSSAAGSAITHVMNANWSGLPGAGDDVPHGHRNQYVHRIVEGGAAGGGVFGGITNCQPPYVAQSPNLCVFSYLFSPGLAQDVATYAGGNPNVLRDLRRAYVAHETGHAVNLYHLRGCEPCMMYPTLSSSRPIPTAFLTGVAGDLECNTCNPLQLIPVTNYDETDTLRIKP